MASGPFARRRDGGVEVTLSEPEFELIRTVVEQMGAILDAPDEARHTERLFPPAYLDDAEAQDEYSRLMKDDLLDGKRRSLGTVAGTLDRVDAKRAGMRVRLSADEAQDWLAVLNDARLTLGTRLAITQESYEAEIDPESPDALAHDVFRYLGYVEEYLLDALM
jgi:uncharacterized protein DUF2017